MGSSSSSSRSRCGEGSSSHTGGVGGCGARPGGSLTGAGAEEQGRRQLESEVGDGVAAAGIEREWENVRVEAFVSCVLRLVLCLQHCRTCAHNCASRGSRGSGAAGIERETDGDSDTTCADATCADGEAEDGEDAFRYELHEHLRKRAADSSSQGGAAGFLLPTVGDLLPTVGLPTPGLGEGSGGGVSWTRSTCSRSTGIDAQHMSRARSRALLQLHRVLLEALEGILAKGVASHCNRSLKAAYTSSLPYTSSVRPDTLAASGRMH